MSSYLKSLDSNHLVTVGEEGFWGYYDENAIYNPENSVSPWASLTGNNFTAQHNFDSIDYASIHYWPDQWVNFSCPERAKNAGLSDIPKNDKKRGEIQKSNLGHLHPKQV